MKAIDTLHMADMVQNSSIGGMTESDSPFSFLKSLLFCSCSTWFDVLSAEISSLWNRKTRACASGQLR